MDVINRLRGLVVSAPLQSEAVSNRSTSATATPAAREAGSSELPAPAAKSNAAKSRFAFTRRLEADEASVHHKNHRHASEADRALILAFDQRIAKARGGATAQQEVTNELNELLNSSIFTPRSSPFHEKLRDALVEFHSCPRKPTSLTRQIHSGALAEACVKIIESEQKLDARQSKQIYRNIKRNAEQFLKSNRLNLVGFELDLNSQLPLPDGAERCSSQKMALETFIKAFPATVRSSGRDHIDLLKKLVTILPNLETHQIADRNAQRRGVLTLEKALKHLPPNDVAEIAAYLMDYVRSLSVQFTRRAIRQAVFPWRINKLIVPGTVLGFLALVGAGSAATSGLVGAPAAVGPLVAGIVIGGAAWMGIEKQVQGTALYMLKRQLFMLRENWGNVDEKNKKILIDSFASMRAQLPVLYSTKKYTLGRFFHSTYIDPSTFEQSNGRLNKLGAPLIRLHDRLVGPVEAKLRLTPHGIKELSKAHPNIRRLVHLLTKYQQEFVQNTYTSGRNTAAVEIDWHKFIGRLQAEDAEGQRALYIHSCFNRIKEMEDYKNGNSKPLILEQLMKICQALSNYDDDFITTFAEAARLAQADCSNNVRQMFRQLWDATVSEMAMKNEGGLGGPAALLGLAHQEFRKESLRLATAEVIGASVEAGIEVENYIAVEIALKDKLGLTDAISGMEYERTTARLVTKDNLAKIEQEALNRIGNQEALIDFLKQYSPLMENIKRKPEYGYAKLMEQEGEAIKKLKEAFSNAEIAALSGVKEEKSKPGVQAEFMRAGEALNAALKSADAKVLETCIKNLLNQYPDATRIGSPALLHEGLPDFSSELRELLGIIGMTAEAVPKPESESESELTRLDPELFNAFRSGIETIDRDVEYDEDLHSQVSEIGFQHFFNFDVPATGASAATQAAASTVQMQHVAPEPTAARSPISPEDLSRLGYGLSNNPGGGDCMLYALGANDEAAIRQMRSDIAAMIEQRDETDAQKNYNAQLIMSALTQTPGTEKQAMEMMIGRHSVPNRVYAQMVRIPGIYIGEDELTAFSQFGENPPNIVLIDSDGTLARFRNGVREAIRYDDDSKNDVLGAAITNADIALYKTPNHWQRIVRTAE